MAIELLHRKESIILTVIDIIDELGIQSLSTREIAKRQCISEGTIFRHFKTKNDVILAVLDYFSKFDEDIFYTVVNKRLNAKQAILFYFDSVVTYYENYPAITALTQLYDVLSYESDFITKIRKILSTRKIFLASMIKEGQVNGEIRSDISSEDLSDIINGTSSRICLNWRIEGRIFSLREKTIDSVTMVLKTFSSNQ